MKWRRFSARNAYRKDKAKSTHKASPEFAGFCLSAVSLLGYYCTIWPRHSGVAGAMLARSVLKAFGQGSFLLWALIGYRGFRLIFNKEDRRPWRYVFVDALLLVAATGLLTSAGTILVGK